MNFTDFLERDINAGFSGGEIKRSELLQLMAQKPDLLLFDEPESGVDLENISLIGQHDRQLLQRDIHFSAGQVAAPGAQGEDPHGAHHHPHGIHSGLCYCR